MVAGLGTGKTNTARKLLKLGMARVTEPGVPEQCVCESEERLR
jgi:hypothetical protein